MTFLESYTYDNHICGSKNKWICRTCKKYFKNSLKLKSHNKNVHEGQEKMHWLCHICDNSNEFPTKNELQFHMKSKHEGMLIPCELCDDQEFLEQYTYQKHINETHKEFTDFKLFVEPKKEEQFEDEDYDDLEETDSNFDESFEEPSNNSTQ